MPQSYSNTNYLKTILTDFISIIYPRVCVGCNEVLLKQEDTLCTHCHIQLPHTHFEDQRNNPVEKLFWMKLPVESASSAYFFSKKSRIQRIIHAFKYHDKPQVAIYMGQLIGKKLQNLNSTVSFDIIIPVPLHPLKKRIRGYNQAEKIAEGIAQVLNIPVDSNSLKRITANKTQTNKGLYDRWINVNSVFALSNQHDLTNKHVLLVDDVITSGSTIEASAKPLTKVPNVKISIASLALANG